MITVKYHATDNSTNFTTLKDFGSPVTYIYESRGTSPCLIKTCTDSESFNYYAGKLGIVIHQPTCTERLEGELIFVGRSCARGLLDGEVFDIL
jgi:hypothetical protein